jgi:hypothetical protein
MARRDTRPDPKEAALAGARCLNPHPEQVTDPEFGASDFFDPEKASSRSGSKRATENDSVSAEKPTVALPSRGNGMILIQVWSCELAGYDNPARRCCRSLQRYVCAQASFLMVSACTHREKTRPAWRGLERRTPHLRTVS